MNKIQRSVVHGILIIFLMTASNATNAMARSAQTPLPPAIARLQAGSLSALQVTWNAASGTVTFVRGRFPLALLTHQAATASRTDMALAFLSNYADVFGIARPADEQVVAQIATDDIGMTHVTLSQVFAGIPVYDAITKVHISSDGEYVVAVSSGYVRGVSVSNVLPQISSESAAGNAGRILPNAQLLGIPQLVIFAGRSSTTSGPIGQLAWLVELRDGSIPARELIAVDATDGRIINVENILYEGLDRQTYTADHGTTLPGTLVRAEGQDATGDADVDRAHNYAGDTYTYYYNTYGRDSYDGQGAAIISTAHYGNNYANAFWDGSQMVYGDGFATNDVVGHELTHAVTERTAALEYRWQSGALNESFSDIFGAMVDRDDWLIGEDLPSDALGGREAIRDMADPTRLGQPAHTSNWVQTCSDNEGVHTNSGIPNKAYYNIATAIGKNKAERIFYRALVTYLQTSSSLEDARASALQAVEDLYGGDSAEYGAVEAGFNAVGLDGQWQPPVNECACSATTALSDSSLFSDSASAIQSIATLYRVRDELLVQTPGGRHYIDLYYQYTGQISKLLLSSTSLRNSGGHILQLMTPGLTQLVNGGGDQTQVTEAMVDQVTNYLDQLAVEARANGDEELAKTIEVEQARLDWHQMIGMSFEEAWSYVNSQIAIHMIYLPITTR